MLLIFLVLLTLGLAWGDDGMPLPFTRQLEYQQPLMTGNDVFILQNLIVRDDEVDAIDADGYFGPATKNAVLQFQSDFADELEQTGIFDAATAKKLLATCSNDGYKDNGIKAKDMGKLYKVYIPVHANRSIESTAQLLDADNHVLHTFTARLHGYHTDGTHSSWPDYSSDEGLNEFTSGGNTVTGLSLLDLNSPEPDPTLYGPFPVNRIVSGVEGNSAFLLPNIRDGLLLHTGNWYDSGWDPTKDMPNSSGCIHAHPEDVSRIYEILTEDLGVEVHDNPFSGKNYPYEPQGIISIQLID